MRLSLVLAVAGCATTGPETGGQTASYPGPYDLVTAETTTGRVEVVRGEVSGVELEFLPSGSDSWTATEDGGTLALVAVCLGDEIVGCGGGLVITVPFDQSVTAKTDTGEIAFGAGLSGTLDAQTASGEIDAVDLDAAELLALTGTGTVTASFAATPREVDLDTGSSDATLTVPAGGYALDLDDGVTVDPAVTDDPAGPPIALHTGTGALTIIAR